MGLIIHHQSYPRWKATRISYTKTPRRFSCQSKKERMIEEKSYNSTNNEEPARAIEECFQKKESCRQKMMAAFLLTSCARLKSPDANVREAALTEVVRVGGDDAFLCITRAFDDQSVEVCNAAARALLICTLIERRRLQERFVKVRPNDAARLDKRSPLPELPKMLLVT